MSLENISKTIATRCCSATHLQGGWCFSRALHASRFSVSVARKCMCEKNATQLGARNTPARLRWCLNDSGRSRIHRPQMAEERRTRTIQHRRSLLNQLMAIGISESWNEGTSFEQLWLGIRHVGQVAKGYRAAKIEITWD